MGTRSYQPGVTAPKFSLRSHSGVNQAENSSFRWDHCADSWTPTPWLACCLIGRSVFQVPAFGCGSQVASTLAGHSLGKPLFLSPENKRFNRVEKFVLNQRGKISSFYMELCAEFMRTSPFAQKLCACLKLRHQKSFVDSHC